ncbi:DUF2218 domain-containing protein [Bradyrhizobium sp. CCBAU 45389]|uniref:DUF2218 domain-containing protein n=1 Tax=Bradyrhizobium sp. CCBAU 45389 TaxID=858429 RepID=UPI0023055A83|nr:DUF2218 domain-containing protein [Bradyrhizobium sp. CCBAU 45389]MDA9397409.1 2,4-dihydroxyhept-2-ene-1,7-dioic acid aldolase [Bradyrhizobium sp. CCBAU 45389]
MNHSVAEIATERASIYLQQLCKHFAHKLPVEFTPEQGTIPFSVGTCRLEAAAGKLVLRADAENADLLKQVEGIVERHLVRFAFRDPPEIVWRSAEQAAS